MVFIKAFVVANLLVGSHIVTCSPLNLNLQYGLQTAGKPTRDEILDDMGATIGYAYMWIARMQGINVDNMCTIDKISSHVTKVSDDLKKLYLKVADSDLKTKGIDAYTVNTFEQYVSTLEDYAEQIAWHSMAVPLMGDCNGRVDKVVDGLSIPILVTGQTLQDFTKDVDLKKRLTTASLRGSNSFKRLADGPYQACLNAPTKFKCPTKSTSANEVGGI